MKAFFGTIEDFVGRQLLSQEMLGIHWICAFQTEHSNEAEEILRIAQFVNQETSSIAIEPINGYFACYVKNEKDFILIRMMFEENTTPWSGLRH